MNIKAALRAGRTYLRHIRVVLLSGALLLCTVGLSGCNAAQTTIKEIGMKEYETNELPWGIGFMGYKVDRGHPDTSAAFHAYSHGMNWFEDSLGNEVGRVEFSNIAEWGSYGFPMGGNVAVRRIPKRMHLKYYDIVAGQTYQLDVDLPQQKMYELLKADRVATGVSSTGNIWHFNDLIIGFAPQGHVSLWVGTGVGGDGRVELAHYQAKAVPFDIGAYNQTVVQGLQVRPRWEELLDGRATPQTVARIKAGWQPSAERYLKQRIRYPWRWSTSDNIELVESSIDMVNFESKTVFAREFAHEQTQLKSPPVAVSLYFIDKKTGQRYGFFTLLYDDTNVERFSDEIDASPQMAAFERLFPNRSAADNDKPVDSSEFAEIHFAVNDDLTDATLTLKKGNVSIPLTFWEGDFQKLEPYTFQNGTPPRSPEQIKRIQFGPEAKIEPTLKVGQICPQTGFWTTDLYGGAQGIFLRKGDKMPGHSFSKAEQEAMVWRLVKLVDVSAIDNT